MCALGRPAGGALLSHSACILMAEDRDLLQFAGELQSEIADRALGDMEAGEFTENAFVDVISEHLAEIGMIENPVTCFFPAKVGTGIVKVSGYAIPDDGERIDILVAIFSGTATPASITTADMTRIAGQGARALLAASRNIHLELETANDRFAMMQRISELLVAGTKQARVIVISDGLFAARGLEPTNVAGVEVSFEIYDIRRLMRTMRTGQTREVIDIDLAALGMQPIPCVAMPAGTEPYETYLAIFSGETLYELYEAYGPRILEYNVRAFLQATGKVNRGIRDTIRDQPGYFMAYNNGISVTADEVRTERIGGVTVITGFMGMQIVNGGQTTASIHRARKRDRLDLSRVHVPAKVTRLPPESVEEMVPQISRYANTQNVIQEADFSSNEPFHIAMERLSKDIWAPGERTRWFYERSRGQYQTAMSIDGSTEARLRAFRERTPPANRISKTDLARFLNSWSRLPHIVSGGVQKNFIAFMRRIRDARGNKWEPEEAFYRDAIAQAILFLAAQRVVRREGFPAYRINITTYLVSYLSHRTGGRLRLDLIWQRQSIGDDLQALMRVWSHAIDRQIQASAAGKNVTEWAKKEACWIGVRQLDLPIEGVLPEEWGSDDTTLSPEEMPSTGDDHASSAACMRLSAEQWFALHLWGTRTGNLAKWQTGIAHTLSSYAGRGWERAPTAKQAKHGVRILEIAAEHGFESGAGGSDE
ncbi:AIPR family protein [Mesorhizobium sp. M1406]|uniref:AIPR family protein n=1 Tax=Mesorhizobium sp. M1406 TaxID=2957099 RepID=UPI00333547A0